MTFQEAVAEMRRLQEEHRSLPWTQAEDNWVFVRKAERRVDQMLSEMSRDMDMEKFDKETENAI